MVLGPFTKYTIRTLGGILLCGGMTMTIGSVASAWGWGDLYFQGILVAAGGAVTCCVPSFHKGCFPEDSDETRDRKQRAMLAERRARMIAQMLADEKAYRAVLLGTLPELPITDICGWFIPLAGVPCFCPLGYWLEDPDNGLHFKDATDDEIADEADRLRAEAERLHNPNCPDCDGAGQDEDGDECETCDGTGNRRRRRGFLRRTGNRRGRNRRPVEPYVHVPCPMCDDSGKVTIPLAWRPPSPGPPNALAAASTPVACSSPLGWGGLSRLSPVGDRGREQVGLVSDRSDFEDSRMELREIIVENHHSTDFRNVGYQASPDLLEDPLELCRRRLHAPPTLS